MENSSFAEASGFAEQPFDAWNPCCDLCQNHLGWTVARERVFFWSFEGQSGLLLLCPACEEQAALLLPPGLRRLGVPVGGLALLHRRARAR